MFLHNFTPHEHHSHQEKTIYFEECDNANSFWDKISLAFHFSPETGHFEQIQAQGNTSLEGIISQDVSNDFLSTFSIQLEIEVSRQMTVLFGAKNYLHDSLHAKKRLFYRPPPAIV